MLNFVWIGKTVEPIVDSPRHVHSFWEVCIYTHGIGEALIGDERVLFKPGTIICYPPNIPHNEHASEGCHEYFIAVENFRPPWDGILTCDDSPDGAFVRLVDQLWREFRLKDQGWEGIVTQLFQLLLTYIDRWRESGQHPFVAQLKYRIVRALDNPDFDATDAMADLPMCRDHLRRLFVRATGLTPRAFLMNSRIEEAKRLLQSVRLSVKETSGQVGFRDPAYFSRVFHKHTGQWPTDFAEATRATSVGPEGYARQPVEAPGTPLA